MSAAPSFREFSRDYPCNQFKLNRYEWREASSQPPVILFIKRTGQKKLQPILTKSDLIKQTDSNVISDSYSQLFRTTDSFIIKRVLN